MKATKQNSSVQLSLFPCQGTGVKDNKKKGCRPDSQVINNYLKTRDGLWRLLACFPGDMPVEEALALAPSVIFGTSQGQKGGES